MSGIVQRELARGQQAYLWNGIQRALRVHIESGDGFDLVVEQIEAVGQHAAHGEQIDDAAAHAVFARGEHLLHMVVARQRHLRAEGIEIEFAALLEEEGVSGEIFHRRQRIQRGGERHDGYVTCLATDVVQRREAFRDQILMRRKMVVRQRLPVRQQIYAQFWIEERCFLEQPLRLQRVGGDDHQRRGFLRELRQPQRVGRAVQVGIARAGMG